MALVHADPVNLIHRFETGCEGLGIQLIVDNVLHNILNNIYAPGRDIIKTADIGGHIIGSRPGSQESLLLGEDSDGGYSLYGVIIKKEF